jgi:hypothetical protein
VDQPVAHRGRRSELDVRQCSFHGRGNLGGGFADDFGCPRQRQEAQPVWSEVIV